MNTHTEDQLRDHFRDVAEAMNVTTPDRFNLVQPTAVTVGPRTRPARRVLAPAAIGVAAVAICVVGLIAIRGNDNGTRVNSTDQGFVTTVPPAGPALFTPSDSDKYSVTTRQVFEPDSSWTGAASTPDGRVFGFSLGEYSGDELPSDETREIGKLTVTASTDGTAPDEIYRTVRTGCIALTVATASEPAFSDDTIRIFGSLKLADAAVNIELPSGWTNLGASLHGAQYVSQLGLAGHTTETLTLMQMPNAPIGVYLATAETAPEPVDVRGDRAWIIRSTTTAGFTTLVGERDGTAFRLDGLATPDQLVAIAETFVRASATDWTGTATPDVQPPATQPPPPACVVPALALQD